MITMKLWWSLWLLDFIHAAKVGRPAVSAPLDLLVQEPGLDVSNHTLFNTLGDKESALALMNATGQNHSLFIDGDEVEHDLDESSDSLADMDDGMDQDIEEHALSVHEGAEGEDFQEDFQDMDHSEEDFQHMDDEHLDEHLGDEEFDPEDNALALASEMGNLSMNASEHLPWRWWHRREFNVHSRWSHRGDDRHTYVDCPRGYWVKHCWLSGGGRNDGNWVSHNGKRCFAQSGHHHERVRAHARCWRVHTIAQNSGHHWRRGNVNVRCSKGEPVGCTCYSAWKTRHQCSDQRHRWRKQNSFGPTHGMCQRYGNWRIKVFALCSQKKCGNWRCPRGWIKKSRHTIGHSHGKCCKRAEFQVNSGWSHRGDDRRTHVDCPHGYWVKKCWVSGGGNNDGAWVSHNGKRCHAQSGHWRENVRAHAICWLKRTTMEAASNHWRGGNVHKRCHHGDAISCNCYSAWKVRHQCATTRHNQRKASTFAPTNGVCKRWGNWRIKVFAVCSQAKCGNFRCPRGYRRKHHNTVGSSVAKCCQKDFKCGNPCKSCPAMHHRHQHNHCNSCHPGWALVGRTCKTHHRVHSGWSHYGDDRRTHVDCPAGMWVKKCWPSGGHWSDGAFVTHSGRRCHAQSGHHRERVRAHADCWTTRTTEQVSGGWKRGNVNVRCNSGDAVSCTCFSAWKWRNQCADQRNHGWRHTLFDPINGVCKRYGRYNIQVYALCSQKPCGNFACPAGYTRKHSSTIGSSAAKCCTPVACPANSHGKNVPSGCKCNAGYHGSIGKKAGGYTGACHLAGCPWWTNGPNVVSGCKCWNGYHGSIRAKVGHPYYKGTCKSVMVGGTFALHNRHHNRFWKMTKRDMYRSPTKNADRLPNGWSQERFKAHEGGHGRIGFLGTWARLWVMMNHGDMAVQRWMRGWERFRMVDAGNGEVAFHQDNHNRFVRMSRSKMDSSGKKGARHLPGSWGWERFKIVQAIPGLKPGSIIALKTRGRFLRTPHGWRLNGWRGGIKQIQDHWADLFYEVKDAGFGQIALFNTHRKQYVRLHTGDIYRSKDLTDECRFTVVDAGGGRIGLHNARHNRFLAMQSNGNAYPTGGRNGDALPGHWHDAIFKFYKIRTCKTGGGSNCRSCPAQGDRKFNNQCNSCNAGYYLKNHKCHVVKCPWWTDGKTVPEGCTCWKGYFGSITATTSGSYYSGTCKSALVGGTFALHNRHHNRFWKMTKRDMYRSPKKNVDRLPNGWSAERFKVMEGGSGRVGFYGTWAKKWMMMNHGDMAVQRWMHGWERFRLVDAGNGEVAFHQDNHNRFVRMSRSKMDSSGHKGARALPSGWGWERFKIVQAVPCMKVGKVITLNTHNRFMNMVGGWHMASHPAKVDGYHEHWGSVRYKVVDGGNGQVALYNEAYKMYIRLTNHDVYRNANLNDESRFTVVDMGNNRVGLHNAKTNRFLAINANGDVYRTGHKNGDALPGNWNDAIFTVTQAFSCSTGGGASCRSCPAFSQRKANNQCNSCNAGYYLEHSRCKPVKCPDFADGTDVPSGCTCWKGYYGEIKASTSSPYYTGTCKSVLVGGTVAFHNKVQNRFMKMVKNDLTRSPKKKADDLPDGWTAERFKIVDGGDGRVGIKGQAVNQYAMMNRQDARSIGHMRDWEKFRIKDAGNNQVALHNNNHNRFLRMSDRTFDTSVKKAVKDLPASWGWERFEVVQAVDALKPGHLVSFYVNGRYLQMTNSWDVNSYKCTVNTMKDNWLSLHFEVADAGMGQIALYHPHQKSFVAMTNTDIKRITKLTDEGHFTVVDMGGGNVALHNAKYNRFIALRSNGGVDRSGVKDGDKIPANWKDAIFHVYQVYKCGSPCKKCPAFGDRKKSNECTECYSGYYAKNGGCKAFGCDKKKCASCVAQKSRKAHAHCATCHSGKVLVGRDCKTEHVVYSGWSSNRDDTRATAVCPEGMWLKRCDVQRRRGNNWDYGDGGFVDNEAKKCTVQTGTARQKMRAKATCSVKFTYGMTSSMKRGNTQTICPKAISCLCHTWWEVRKKCDGKAANFNPTGGYCKRSSRGKKAVSAICEVAGCSTGTGSSCKSCVPFRERAAIDHCASCNPGYYISGTSCKAYACGGNCKTCVAQDKRTKDNQCASCHPGHYLDGNVCKPYGCNTKLCKTCVAQNSRKNGAHCATCHPGYYESRGKCKAYGCNTDVCATCVAQKHRQDHVHCKTCPSGTVIVGRTCKSSHVVKTGWSGRRDDTSVTAQCPAGMWLKKCQVLQSNRNDWGDGAVVDSNAQKCTAYVSASRKRVRAKATCSTKQTYGLASPGGYKRGTIQTICPKAIACTCHSWWEAKRRCDNGKPFFDPVNGICKLSRNEKKRAFAICEEVSCSTGSGSKCKTCKAVRDRAAVDHCDTCNPGYYVSGTVCKAYSCGGDCKACVEQQLRTKNDHCSACHSGYYLENGECKPYTCTMKKCSKCVKQNLRTQHEHCAECRKGFFLEGPNCKAYGCDEGPGDKCKTCVKQSSRKEDDHCGACNGGHYLFSRDCKAFSCKEGKNRMCSSCQAQAEQKMDGHCKSCNFGYVLKDNVCQSVMVGSVIALHNGAWKRFVKMSKTDLTRSPKRSADTFPIRWTAERFEVLDAGKGRVTLKNLAQNKVISAKASGDLAPADVPTPQCQDGKFGINFCSEWCNHAGFWGCGISKIIGRDGRNTDNKDYVCDCAGCSGCAESDTTWVPVWTGKEVAFHSAARNAWMQMTGNTMFGKTSYTADQLAGDWTHFQIRQPHPLLAPGSIIALWSPKFKQFLSMSSKDMTVTKRKAPSDFPDKWKDAKFQVVDAGFGLIALYNQKEKRFIKLQNANLMLSPKRSDGSLPDRWGAERFTVVHAGKNQFAFHNPFYNRFVRLADRNRADTSSQKNAEDLPSKWTWERFEIYNVKYSCSTGDGLKCKSCKNPNDRTVNNHCATCNDGYKLVGAKCEAVACPADSTGKSIGEGCSCNAGFSGAIQPAAKSPYYAGVCSAVACPSWAEGKDVPSGCTCMKGYFGELKASKSNPYYTGSCKSALVGGTIALHNKENNRFMKMESSDMERSPARRADALPTSWSKERFKVLEGDSGRVGLKNLRINKYVMMHHSNMKTIGHMRGWEKFRVVEQADGTVAFHNSNHNRFIRLGNKELDTSRKKNMKSLPTTWSWERFEVVQAVPGLDIGSVIAFHNNGRFLQMDETLALSSSASAISKLSDQLDSVRFQVVDAGLGQLAFYNTQLQSFMAMGDKDMMRTGKLAITVISDDARFTVVDMGNGKIALHNAKYNRFVVQRPSGEVARTVEKDGDKIPSTWTDAIFTVVQAHKCSTGSGKKCKSCAAPGLREAANHCASCNAGFALVGRRCKDTHVAYSGWSRTKDDQRAAAKCPEGMWMKKCEVVRGGDDFGDGAYVDNSAKVCTVQTGNRRQKLKAKATCSTTETFGMASSADFATGQLSVPCPKAIACTCYSFWTVSDKCGNVPVFEPQGGVCKSTGGKRKLHSICEILPCSTGAGAKCKTCKGERTRQAEDHCETCNPGYYLSGTGCKAYACKNKGGSSCKTCVAQNKRTADNQCASCNPGWALVGQKCKKEHTMQSGQSKKGDDKRASVTCPAGMWVKKCWGGRRADGSFVSKDGKTCTAQATHGMRVRAHAVCWTIETLPQSTKMRKGGFNVDCKTGDAIGCTCFSWWRVRSKCWDSKSKKSYGDSFDPVNHKCKRWSGNHRVQVTALCSQEKCSTFECGAGYLPKPGTTTGSSTESCCTPVACPAGSSGDGLHSGCTCNAGFTGSISKSSEGPHYFTGSCDAVACPENSNGKSVADGCTCNAGYSGIIKATSTAPFFSGECVKTCGLFTCPKGWQPKGDEIVGSKRSACCEPVACPSGSSGKNVVKGCKCKAGFSGKISKSKTSPYYEGSCTSVDCPANSEGANVPAGCTCEEGYSGSIKAIRKSPFYDGACAAVACPANSVGNNVPSGCSCSAGFSGAIAKSAKDPFYTGSCSAVKCPDHSTGTDVSTGCSCNAGYSGTIAATTTTPFYSGECKSVACPVNSEGTDVASGCKCKEGYKGSITATTADPFYTGSCTPVACPAHSSGTNVPGGCECLAGYSGTITGDDQNPYYEGTCAAVACPAGASGTNLPSGCACKAGYSGTVVATKTSPFFNGGCTAVACPAHSHGTNVPSGCTCDEGYTGSITATSSSPFFTGSCLATCSLVKCPVGFKPKAASTLGNTEELCCEAVLCPSNSKGDSVAKGCSCNAGFSGSVTAIASSPYYQNGCTAVKCPSHSTGDDVASGCTCDAGYSGSITATSATPFFEGTCQAVACPQDSTGTSVPSGCKCNAGFSGSVVATQAAPFYTSTCQAVACPSHATGKDVPSGCSCNAGYSGSIAATSASPFFSGSCDAVACPKNSKGVDVPSGCTCKDGFIGSVAASTAAPFYTTSCTAVECPADSTGADVVAGCVCNAGFTGVIAAAPSGFSGKCTSVACPAHSSGTDITSGCKCDAGYFGAVTAKIGAPFYDGGCTAWGCTPGAGAQCQSCVEQAKRTQADHCASCNVGFYIDEPGCKALVADQKCGGATCAKSCEGEKCGFKCAGSLLGQEECARDCKGAECGSQCVGGNCASSCQGDKCGYECSGGKDVQQCSMGCKGMECGYYCRGTECAKQCEGDRCGSYCAGQKGAEGHCAFQCKGRQCGYECIGAMCAAECTGDRCAYRCQGSHEDVGTCGTKCKGLECAYRCEGSGCAELCEGERCGLGCASGSGSSQTCAKQCKGEECGSQCVGGLCAAKCNGRKCAYQCSGSQGEQQACGSECVGTLCAAKCTGAECAKGCQGDFCGKECSGTLGDKSHCAAGCVGRRCAAGCKGAYCAAGCQGVGCANGCEGDNCDAGCKGEHCSKGANPTNTCQEALAENPKLCGLRSAFKDEVIFGGEDAKDVCCSKTDCPKGYELVDGVCEKPKCKGKLVQGCYTTNYTACDSSYIKYETEYIQCGVSGPNCLSDAVCEM